MNRYWLTPVVGEEPVSLGGDRKLLEAGTALEDFRGKLQRSVHPRFLPMVKAFILPGDPGEQDELATSVCGTEEAPSLAEPGDIVFDGAPYSLSECGRAFIDRLPLLREQEAWLDRALSAAEVEGWSGLELQWLRYMETYIRSGQKVMLVKEE